jgi:hypothetical protein
MYNRWEQDIALMKSLGIKNYRCVLWLTVGGGWGVRGLLAELC